MKFLKIIVFTGICLCLVSCTKSGGDDGGGGADIPKRSSLCGAETRVSNGKSCSNPGSSPVVELILADSGGNPFASCSGTLIKPSTVLTAAHCLDPRLGVGQVYVDRDGKKNLIAAREMIVHPLYSGIPGDPNDVGILKLLTPINSRPTVPLVLSHDVNPGDRMAVYGYGLDGNDGAGTLREGKVEVGDVHNGTALAEFDKTGNNVCSGDSGGPATFEANGFAGIIGINSAGSASGCKEGSLGLFVLISFQSNLDFILSQVTGVSTI